MQYAAFVACCLIWGSTFLAIRIGNQALPPEWAATLRLVLAAPLLALVVVIRRDRWPRGEALKAALLFGVFNFGVNLGLLYWGERVVPSGIAAVLYATVPLSTAFIAAALGVERLQPRKLIAAIVAIAGGATIFAGEMRLDVPFEGLIAVFLAATAASLSSVFLKRAPQPSVFSTNAIGAAAGAIIGGQRGAASGAGAGLIIGGASGAGAAAGSQRSLQQRYDNGYQQCMYAKGHKVPMAGRYENSVARRPEASTYTPPPPPPGSAPPSPPGYR